MTGEREYKLWLLLGDTIFRNYYKKCVSSLNLNGSEHVMDFGCGPGLVSQYFAENLKQGHLTCVDVSESAIKLARNKLKNYANIDFFPGDILNARFTKNSYDVIFLNFVYYHINNSNRIEIMKKLVELLHKDGRLIIRNAVSEHSGITAELIKKELAQTGLQEIHNKMTRSLFIVPTYCGIFSKA